jgi:fibronectin type 3 domain-containing protein
MMKKRFPVRLAILGMILLTGCGAGSSGDTPSPTPETNPAASIDLLVSNPQLNSDGATTVALTAIVKDSSNRALSGKSVSFSADSGVLAVTSGTTDANGTATATLGTGGNPTNRTIRVSASTGSISAATNNVTVTGTALSISGAASLSSGDTTPLTIFLKDSAGAGIVGKTVTVTSANGNTLSPASAATNASGQVIVNVTATVGGTDKITASSIGATKGFDLTVNTTILTFITPPPLATTEIPIGTNQTVTVAYMSGTIPQPGVTVNFLTTRGALSSASAVTGANGRATVTVASTNSGPALLVASIVGGPTAQAAVEFVAPTPSSLTLQATPATIGTNSGGLTTEKSLITAVVRDANDNLVKNKTVSFTIINDASAGSLTPASSITDSFGTASTYFISGASPGGLGGVTIRASVVGTAVTATTSLTVARKSLFIALAAGNEIKTGPVSNSYLKEFVALVTDSAGNPVVGATVVPTIVPLYYQKGYYTYSTSSSRWTQVGTLVSSFSTHPGIPACWNEDLMTHNPLYDFNGVLDPGEDQNGNNRLDPGDVVSVTATVTNSSGLSTVSLVYAEDYAYWVTVKLETFTGTSGSTASAFVDYTLEGMASDFVNPGISPPGNPSPFGTSWTCYVDLTVTAVSTTEMALSWQKSATANRYRVYRNGIYLAETRLNTYFDTGLSNGTTYCYRITQVDALGNETSLTTTVCNSTAMAAPTGLTATALSSTQIQVSWTASTGAAGYYLYRDSAAAPIKTVAANSVVDSGLTANTSYCYAVASFNASGVQSPKSGQVCVTTRLAAPDTPTLTATLVSGPKVNLSWTTSAGATSYRIYRNGTLLLTSTAAPATDTSVLLDHIYCYTISAVDAAGNESAQSDPVCVTVVATPPATPTGLTVAKAGGLAVNITWTASTGAVGYNIYRNGAFVAAPTAAPVVDTVPVAGFYCYTISALDAYGNESARSATPICLTLP